MAIKKFIKSNRTHNKCKHCSIASRCLTAGMSKDIIKQIGTLKFKSRTLSPGEHLYRQGDLLENLYLIRSGILKSYTIDEEGSEFIMGFYLPPCLFGWEGIDEQQLSVSVTALDHSNICEIPIEVFGELMSQHPTISMQLLKLISQRVGKDSAASLRSTAEQRVASFILQLTKHYTMLGYPYYLCKLVMTHQDIANYLRIAPETISRTLHNLQTKGIIGLSRKTIYLNDIKTLTNIANQM